MADHKGDIIGKLIIQAQSDALRFDHSSCGIVAIIMTAGENVVIGDACYVKAADSKLWKADATQVATMPCIALATETINADDSGEFLLIGFLRDDTWALAAGGNLYVDTTPGNPTQAAPVGAGNQVQILGVAITTTIIYFCPSLELVEIS